jgi:hypothetical protein
MFSPVEFRQSPRIHVEMSLRSASLPRCQARITDISSSGARIVLRGAVSKAFENRRIRFGASLAGQQSAHFEGLARVVWIARTERGWEAGLQWEPMTTPEWSPRHLGMEHNAA